MSTPLHHMLGMDFLHEEKGHCKVDGLRAKDEERTTIIFRYSATRIQSVVVANDNVENELHKYGFERV